MWKFVTESLEEANEALLIVDSVLVVNNSLMGQQAICSSISEVEDFINLFLDKEPEIEVCEKIK